MDNESQTQIKLTPKSDLKVNTGKWSSRQMVNRRKHRALYL